MSYDRQTRIPSEASEGYENHVSQLFLGDFNGPKHGNIYLAGCVWALGMVLFLFSWLGLKLNLNKKPIHLR